MRNFIKILVIFALCSNVYAWALPNNCKLIDTKSEKIMLNGTGERLIFFHNISDTDIYLTHFSKNDASAQAGWTSRINKNKWSVLKLSQKALIFQCVEVKPGHEQQISCQSKFSICRIFQKTIPSHPKGSFWVAENQPISKLLQTVSNRGFQLTTSNDDNG